MSTFLQLVKFPEWMLEAVCASVDPELFFPENGGSTSQAKAICNQCPVSADCLDYALAYESGTCNTALSYPSGIYGGLSERERRQLRRVLAEEASTPEPKREAS